MSTHRDRNQDRGATRTQGKRGAIGAVLVAVVLMSSLAACGNGPHRPAGVPAGHVCVENYNPKLERDWRVDEWLSPENARQIIRMFPDSARYCTPTPTPMDRTPR